MTVAPIRSGVLRPGHPVQLRAAPGSTSRPVVAEKTYAERPPPGLPPDRHARRPAPRPRRGDGRPAPRPSSADTRACSAGPARTGGSSWPTRRRTPCGCAAQGSACAIAAAAHGPHPVQRHLPLPRPGRRRARVHLVRDRPPLPDHRAVRRRRRRVRRAGARRRRPRLASPPTGDEPWEIAIEEFDTRPPRPTAAGRPSTRSSRPRGASSPTFVDAVAPWRASGTPAAELAAYVLWSATVARPGFVTRPAVLMSKHWMDKVWSWDHCFKNKAEGN